MKGSRDLKRYVARKRSTEGKPNGVLGPWVFDFHSKGAPHSCRKNARPRPRRHEILAEAE